MKPNPKIRWSTLTDEQKLIIKACGCGPGTLIVKDVMYEASCQVHDFHYARGGTELDRWKADFWFFHHMIKDCIEYSDTKRALFWNMLRASLYFNLVFVFGWAFFSYGEYRSWEDTIEKLRK